MQKLKLTLSVLLLTLGACRTPETGTSGTPTPAAVNLVPATAPVHIVGDEPPILNSDNGPVRASVAANSVEALPEPAQVQFTGTSN